MDGGIENVSHDGQPNDSHGTEHRNRRNGSLEENAAIPVASGAVDVGSGRSIEASRPESITNSDAIEHGVVPPMATPEISEVGGSCGPEPLHSVGDSHCDAEELTSNSTDEANEVNDDDDFGTDSSVELNEVDDNEIDDVDVSDVDVSDVDVSDVDVSDVDESEMVDEEAFVSVNRNPAETTKQIAQTFTLLVMLAAVLSPAFMYSFGLHDPTLAQLLIAVCTSLFCCLSAIWVLDLTSNLNFKFEWVSRSLFMAAIVCILGASIGVYSGVGSGQAHPFDGPWELSLASDAEGKFVNRMTIVVTYSPSAESYWGFSDAKDLFELIRSKASGGKATTDRHVPWVELYKLDPIARQAEICIYDEKGIGETLRCLNLEVSKSRTQIKGICEPSSTQDKFTIEFTRPK